MQAVGCLGSNENTLKPRYNGLMEWTARPLKPLYNKRFKINQKHLFENINWIFCLLNRDPLYRGFPIIQNNTFSNSLTLFFFSFSSFAKFLVRLQKIQSHYQYILKYVFVRSTN